MEAQRSLHTCPQPLTMVGRNWYNTCMDTADHIEVASTQEMSDAEKLELANQVLAKVNRPATGRKKGDGHLMALKPWHDELARRLVIGCQKQYEIANELGVTQTWLSTILTQPLMKRRIRALQDERDKDSLDVGKQLDAAALPALEILERTMYKTKSEKLAVMCAKDLLDRAGHGAINKSVNENRNINIHAHMGKEEMMRVIINRMKTAKGEAVEKIKDLEDTTIEAEWTEAPTTDENDSPAEREPGCGVL